MIDLAFYIQILCAKGGGMVTIDFYMKAQKKPRNRNTFKKSGESVAWQVIRYYRFVEQIGLIEGYQGINSLRLAHCFFAIVYGCVKCTFSVIGHFACFVFGLTQKRLTLV